MLTITNVKKTFNKGTVNEKKALNDINLHLAPGDFVTIIGGNGAGKSTMLNMIAGVYPIDSGKIEIDGVNISREPEYKRAKYIGRVFQDPMRGTAANMEIQENLAMALRRGKSIGLGWGIKKNEKDFYREALAQLDLGLQTRMTSKVGLLSGGQRQALTLLMATLQKPKLLLLDEHTAALAPKHEEDDGVENKQQPDANRGEIRDNQSQSNDSKETMVAEPNPLYSNKSNSARIRLGGY